MQPRQVREKDKHVSGGCCGCAHRTEIRWKGSRALTLASNESGKYSTMVHLSASSVPPWTGANIRRQVSRLFSSKTSSDASVKTCVSQTWDFCSAFGILILERCPAGRASNGNLLRNKDSQYVCPRWRKCLYAGKPAEYSPCPSRCAPCVPGETLTKRVQMYSAARISAEYHAAACVRCTRKSCINERTAVCDHALPENFKC